MWKNESADSEKMKRARWEWRRHRIVHHNRRGVLGESGAAAFSVRDTTFERMTSREIAKAIERTDVAMRKDMNKYNRLMEDYALCTTHLRRVLEKRAGTKGRGSSGLERSGGTVVVERDRPTGHLNVDTKKTETFPESTVQRMKSLSSLSSQYVPKSLRNRFVEAATNMNVRSGRCDPDPWNFHVAYAPAGGFAMFVEGDVMRRLVFTKSNALPDRFTNEEMETLKRSILMYRDDRVQQRARPIALGRELSSESLRWLQLLWAEELQIEIDMRLHDIHNTWLMENASSRRRRSMSGNDDDNDDGTSWKTRVIVVSEAPEQRPHVYTGLVVKLRPSVSRVREDIAQFMHRHVRASHVGRGALRHPHCMLCFLQRQRHQKKTGKKTTASPQGDASSTCSSCANIDVYTTSDPIIATLRRLHNDPRAMEGFRRWLQRVELQAAVVSRSGTEVTIELPPIHQCASLLPQAFSTDLHVDAALFTFVTRHMRWHARFDTTLQRRGIGFMRVAAILSQDMSLTSLPAIARTCETTQITTDADDRVSTTQVFNKALSPQQRDAVFTWLRPSFPTNVPFVIWGPPGTGKTSCTIEMIMQLLVNRSRDDVKVLVTAPSNAAADVVMSRIAAYKRTHGDVICKTYVRRFNSPTRPIAEIFPSVLPFCDIDYKRGSCAIPTPEELRNLRMICCTCGSAGFLRNVLGEKANVFTHIICDEASQAWEPETMVALSLGDRKGVRVMLSGDPKQLGPGTRCQEAAQMGLRVSLQERLMESESYTRWTAQSTRTKRTALETCGPRVLFQLQNNYRSHATMLHLPSLCFYGGTTSRAALLCCADPRSTDAALRWSRLTRRHRTNVENKTRSKTNASDGFPIVFVDVVEGKQKHAMFSRSLYNRREADRVVSITDELLSSKDVSFTTNDIGVIAAFRAQVKLIRNQLRAHGLGAIRVGTIDDYQGQEEKVILISTVVSDPRTLNAYDRGENDANGPLGLFSNPRRFNVAISRAKSLLICVGQSLVIGHDPYWRALLSYVQSNGGYWSETEFEAFGSESPPTTTKDAICKVASCEKTTAGGIYCASCFESIRRRCFKDDDDSFLSLDASSPHKIVVEKQWRVFF